MKYVDTNTGEIIELVPYGVQRTRARVGGSVARKRSKHKLRNRLIREFGWIGFWLVVAVGLLVSVSHQM